MNQLCLYKSSSYRNILCLLFLDFASVANASYPLPYWNNGGKQIRHCSVCQKQAIRDGGLQVHIES